MYGLAFRPGNRSCIALRSDIPVGRRRMGD